jgi:predicted transcriptional regulator
MKKVSGITPVEEFIPEVVKSNLSYKQKLLLIYLRTVNDWVSLKSLQESINVNKDSKTTITHKMSYLIDHRLIEKKGNNYTGVFYRVSPQ